MPFRKSILYFYLLVLFVCCHTRMQEHIPIKEINNYINKNQVIQKKEWHFKDIEKDSLPGISLEKAYSFLSNKKPRKKIIVAIIDTELDIENEDLKGQIWVNKNEVPNNDLDDDRNGYVDDIHGWNFIGTSVNDTIPYTNYEYTRIIRKYDSIFKDVISIEDLPKKVHLEFINYKNALKAYEKELKWRKNRIAAFGRMRDNFIKSKKVASFYIPYNDFTISKLDSLYANIDDKETKKRILQWKSFLIDSITLEDINEEIKRQKLIKDVGLNINFNDRYTTDDNPHDLKDILYGNNNIQGTKLIGHATNVSSIIAATRNNGIGINGINDNVAIMSLGISVAGNEFDKDIALAIRYAVDNGAKIINMSIGKKFSMYPEWVEEAIKYAEEKEVLIVTSAGNEGVNLDFTQDYPNDMKNDTIEFVENFIKVGNSSYRVNDKLIYSNSNYGKKEVDIFAPGTAIACLDRKEITTTSGTSLAAPMVTGIASLIFSYYPNLSAKEVKLIILESGVSYNINVLKPYADDEKRDPNKVPFSSLSKSGKIVNAYNALLMAEEVSKKKKKRK